jgi:hypothetical protein
MNTQSLTPTAPATVVANIKTLVVVQVTPMHSKKDNSIIGYKHKLQTKSVVTQTTAFGPASQGHQETYYMKLDNPCDLGFSAPIDLSLYNVVEEPFTPTEGENAGKEMFLKNIYLKG